MDLKSLISDHAPSLPAGLDWAIGNVGGDAKAGHSRLIYAASEEPLVDVPDANEAEIETAVTRARDAFASGPWRRTLPSERARILARIADAVLAHTDELAVLHTLETGIPVGQARGIHIPRAAENFRFFGELTTSLSGESYEQTGKYLSVVTREPIGVGLLIAPWNAPLVLGSMKMAAAIALGNSIIVKPSEYAPLSLIAPGRNHAGGRPAGGRGAGRVRTRSERRCGVGSGIPVSTQSVLSAEPRPGEGSWPRRRQD